ncbi:DUF928 domain-containing protein [Spirulina sp. CS-785/01]|uniref:DUF928 domain-containing protein n=1 Tax=Spirulina sp. CS-785/01 TaxID=3021716 RepID=UPI00232F4F81|nr:DUF928 domain-containing protein [Spirulina sp. CS-785/01]
MIPWSWFKLSLGVIFLNLTGLITPLVVTAQSPLETNSIIFNQPTVSDDRGNPPNSESSASRDPCPNLPLGLTPLTPVTPDNSIPWGYTRKSHPSFWFYSPYSPDWVENVKLSLRTWDEEEKREIIVYESDIRYTASGIMQIALPPDAPPLTPDTWYKAYLFVEVYCTETSPLSRDSSQFLVLRKPSPPLPTNTPLPEKARIFARQGYWFDALNAVAASNQSGDWEQLLEEGGLGEFSEFPREDCCTSEN